MSIDNFETFASLNIKTGDINTIGGGVIPEIAEAFGYDLPAEPSASDLGGLIGAVGPAAEFQKNIGLVQAKLGTDMDAIDLARSWVIRSGLLIPVERNFYSAEEVVPRDFDVAIISGGVRNWMNRRAEVLQREIESGRQIGRIVLVGGNRRMQPSEGNDVVAGMTEGDYLQNVIKPKLVTDTAVEVFKPNTSNGDEVFSHVADRISGESSVLVATNAGNWLQNSGQMLRSLVARDSGRNEFPATYVISDAFELGTGTEPAATHQNPFTALGQIVRNAQEIVRHQT